MPIFENNGKKQRVQDAHVEKYMELYPDATTIMERDGKKYRVKAKDYNTFLGDTLEAPKMESAPTQTVAASPAPKAEDITPTTNGGENGYTFTAEELGIEEPKGEPEDLSKYKDILPPVDETVKAAMDRVLEVERDAVMKEFGTQDNASYMPAMEVAAKRMAKSEDPIDREAARIYEESKPEFVDTPGFLDAVWHATEEGVTAAKDFVVEDVVGRAAGAVTYPIYKTVEGIGDVTGIKAVNRFGKQGAERAAALAENREVNGRSAVEDEFLDARNNILYKNGKDGKLTWVGTFLQSTEELVAGVTDPVYRGLDWVGEKTGINLLEEMGEAGRANIDEIYENSQYKDNSVVGKFFQLAPQVVGTVVSLMTGNPIAAKASMYAMVGSSMGSAAREAEKEGASLLEQLGTAVFTGLVEFGTERYSLGHWLGKMASKAGNKVFKEAGQEVVEKETEELFQEARKAFGKKITAKTAKEFAKDLLVEGGSEATAEFLQTFTPIIYRDKDKWPTWYEAMQNAWDGAIGGWMMAGPLHLTGSYAQRKANNKRRAEQGYVDAAMITIKDKSGKEKLSIAEIVGEDENHNLIALVDNQPVTVKKEDVKKRQQFSYEEFRNGGMEVYREEGYNTDPATVNGNTIALANKSLDNAKAGVRAVLNLGEDADVDAVIAGKEFEGEAKAAVDTYLAEKAKVEGMRDRFNEQRENEIAEAEKEVDAVMHEDGNVYITTLPSTGEDIFITGGKVVLDNEGYIDVNQSEGLVALMPNGKKEAIQPGNIREKVSVENAQAQKAAKRAEIDNRYKSQLNTFVYSDSEGDHTVMLVGRRGDMVDALIDGKPTEVPAKEFEAIMADATGKQPVEVNAVKDEKVVTGDNVPAQATAVEQPVANEVPVSAPVEQLPKEKQTPAPIPTEKRGKTERAAYHLVPIERTMEDLHDGALEADEIESLIDARIKEAENDVNAIENKKPVIGADKDAYVAAKKQWQEAMDAAKAKLDYYNNLKAVNAEVTRSEMREAVEGVAPQTLIEQTADEFVANQLGGWIKITPESFQKETGLKAEQKQMVGVIAGKDKGGMTIEQAAETILENYGDELRGLGFNGDMQDMRDMIINILSNGNPRSYAKKGAEMRAQESVEQQRSELESVAHGLNFNSIEEQIEYEEAVVPRIIQDYTGFDEQEYFNNLAENYENDTTRESENTRGGSELLQGEQAADNAGVGDITESGQGGEIQGDVYSGGENAAPQGNQQPVISETPQPANEMQPVSETVAPTTAEEVADAQAFAEAFAQDTVEAYQNYLDNHPEGAYRDGARAGMWMIEGVNPETHGLVVDARNAANEVLSRVPVQEVTRDNVSQVEGVAEGGNAPGQSGVVDNNSANALQNGNNELNLQKENESYNEPNQNDIPVGGQVPQSVPQGEYGENAAQVGGAQETAARLRERIESAQGDSKSGLREVENRVTREFAQENGLWIEDEFKLGVPFPSGYEHNNYIDAENQVVYKVNNRMHTPSILDLLDRIEQHNKYFPNTQYRLVGFTAISKNGDVMPVFAQGFVPDARMATVDEIDSYMGTLGFTRVGDGRYSNGEVVIKDLKPRNVLADADGDIYVVDAEFEQAKAAEVQAAEAEVNTAPTDKQKEAGNYKKGHVKIGPFNISIEQPKGSVRSGVDKDGKKWEVEMQNTYGYFRGTEGVDGDHIDVFLSNDIDGWDGRQVFVVDQRNADGSFDEHKVMLGFNDINDAEAAYMSNYKEGWQGLGTITGVSIEEFEKWLSSSHRKTKAFVEYKNVKINEGQSTSAESSVLLSDEVADVGPVNRETLQLNMSEEDFNALLNSGDKAAISEYLAEMDGLLRIGAGSPLDGRDTIVKEYRGVVEQYGGEENIPADVVAGIDERIAPYNALQRAVFDRKYALQDKLREIEANEAQAKEQAEKEAKAEHKKTAFGGFLAGKTDLRASVAEKALSKKYNFDGKVMTVAEFVEDAVGNGNVKLSAIEEPKYKGASRAAWNRMDARQQEADAKRVKESGTKTVYTVNDHNFGKNAYDYAKFLQEKKAAESVAPKVEETAEVSKEVKPVKIEDVGEKIGGARKDVIRKYADKIKLDGKTFGTMFPKPEIDQLVEAGLPLDRVAAVKAMFDNAKREYERTKKRMGKDKALSASLFYAMYAKNVLNGETDNFDLKYNGWVFTDWGKEYMKANIALYRAVFEKLGAEYGKMDLAKYAITPLDAQHKKMLNLKALNESNARMQALRAKEKGEEPPVYKDGDLINFVGENHARPSDQFETLEEAVNAMVERIGKEVKPGTEALYKPEVYWKTDERGRADYSKTFVGVKVRGFGTVDLMEFKSSNEARQWLDEHGDDFQQMAAAKEVQVKAENKKPLPKYSIEYTLDRVNSQYAVVANFGRGKVHTLRTFDFPEDDARARMSVFKDEVIPFLNSQEAVQAANEYAEELQQKKSAPKNVVVEKNSRERVGVDWRNGQDATTEMFVDVEGKEPSVFGFRALEFGNYVSQKERQQYLNDIYDALMDMSEVLGVSPRALSLGGKLALAVGARGTSGASGHYEPYKNVINITKTKGAGVLAHEWLHALDRYFSNFDENALYPNGVRYATGKEYAENTRQEIKDAFEKIMSAVRGGEYQKRSARLGDYWASDKELAARALQDYMMRKLDERGQKNDFLSNHLAPEDWAGDMNNYPFPLGAEADRIAEAFDNFFATVEEKTEDGQTVLFQQGMIELDRENPAFERATENVRKKLEATGVKVKVLTKEKAESELARLEELADMQKRTAPETVSVQDEHLQTVVSSAGKRKSPETALPEDESSFKGTAISSDDGAKILKDIDSAIAKYENSNDRAETFIGNVAKALGIDAKDKSSKYATFEAKNGVIFTIRISNHNATVSNFDNAGEGNGISIVISRKPNEGITNDGNAHLVEFFYPEKKISKADGKPLVEILKSIKQTLYSGEYKDNTGLAQPEEVNIPEFLRTPDGVTYGWAVNGEIYLTPEGLNPNTPIHEYTHLWAAALQKSNPKLWGEVVEAMKLSPAWNEVMADDNYTDIHGDENRVASEVLSRLSGNEGYRRYMEQAEAEIAAEKNLGEKVRKKGALNFFKRIWNKFRNWLQGVFKSGKAKAGDSTEAKTEPWDVFVNKTLKDFDEGMNPDAKDSPLDWMFIGKKGAENLDKTEETTTRLAEQKAKQEALKENAKAIRRLHNVTSKYPITALRNLGFALETQEQREMHDRLFAERDAITGESMPAGLQTNPQAMTLQERITESLLKLAEQEKENVEMRLSAIRAYGRDLANVIKLMNAQKGYDKRTVRMFTDLVKMYMRNNAMKGMSSYKIIRLLNLMQKATGGYAKTVNRAAVKIAEIITSEHTSQLKEIMEKQMKTGAERVNASGVVVQGGVDIIGKRILNTYKSAIELKDDKDFEQKYNDAFKRVGEIQKQIEQNGSNKALENQLKEAQAEADAMLLAATYRNEVKAADADITKIKDELTGKRTKAEKGEITWREYHEFAKTINSQIVQLRAQQIDAYQKVLHALSGDIYEGVQRARAFREAEAMRVQKIHDMAENDMNGVSKSAERKEPGIAGKAVDMMVYKRWSVRAVMNGMGTYENYMKYFGRDYVDGKGELFNYFITAFNEAQDKEWKESQNDFNILEAAAQKIFGKKRIGKTYKAIARESTKGSGVILKYWNGGATVERELTIGQLMYLYMTEKQAEGQMKLRNMGLTEEKVHNAVAKLPAKYKAFADYIQSQFLPQMRPRMNEVHQRMFGASMSEVENYFPLKVNMDARQGDTDLNNSSDPIPSTITGAVIKRRVNVTPIDLMENAFDVLNEHIVDMEHWAAFAEFTRDNNTLINDKDFKNRVKNTKGIRYGDGETAWNDFVDTARIVTGNYKARKDYLAKLMSGANAAKITFGGFTALKQIASLPAFLGDANVFDLMWTASTPVGWWSSWNWAIKNLPGFEERWKGRTGGNERLGENEYSIHDSRIMKAARKVGMTPNAFIDAVVVASGARAVYNTRLRFYKKLGMTEYEADRRAKNDAAISYNETQQSGQGAYLSSLQKDSGLVAMLTTLFRNSQMAFQRRVVGSMVGIGKKLARGERIREATKQKYIKMGVDEATAEKQATKEFYMSYAKDFTNLAIFGYGMNYLWVLMGQLPYLLFGDDDEEKEKIFDMAKKVGVTGMFEGFTLGNFAKGLYEKHITDGKYAVGLLEAPFEGDLQKVIDSFEKDGTAAGILQLGIILTEMNTGISPQRLIDLAAAFIDDSDGDVKLANDGVLLGLRILEAPQSQQDMLILDEIYGADAEKVKKVAERYINYKMKRNFPLGSEDEKRVDKYANKFVEILKERVEKEYSPEDISVIFDQSSDTEKEILKKKWIEGMDERNGTNVAKSLRKEKLEELLGSPVEKAAAKALHRFTKTNPYEKMETFDDLERWYEYDVLLDVFKKDYQRIRDEEEMTPEERAKAVEHYGVYADKGFKEVINAIKAHKKLIKENNDPEWRMGEIRRLTDIATEIMKRYE